MTREINLLSDVPSNRRESRIFGKHLVNFRFQLKFALIVFLLLAISTCVTWLIAKTTINTLIMGGYVTGDQAKASLRMINVIIAQTGSLTLLVTFLVALFFSHYIAGPIYRFERILEEMRDGNLNLHVRLRGRDEFKETAVLFNEALSSLRHRVNKERGAIQDSIDKLTALAEDLKVNGRENEAQQLHNLIADIKNLPPQLKI